MSFDLAVIHIEEPISAEDAGEIYRRLCDGDYEVLRLSESIDRFYQELTSRYPNMEELSDEEIDESPWSVSPDVSDGAVMVSIRWSRADDMSDFIKELSTKHGLACYDPQEDVIHLPTTLVRRRS
jgi:hypothetical protein